MKKKYIYIDQLVEDAFDGCVVYVLGKYLNVAPFYVKDDIKCDLRDISGNKAIVEYGNMFWESIETVRLSRVFVLINDEKYYLKKRSLFNTIKDFIGDKMDSYKNETKNEYRMRLLKNKIVVPVEEAAKHDDNVKKVVDDLKSGKVTVCSPFDGMDEPWTDEEIEDLHDALSIVFNENDK